MVIDTAAFSQSCSGNLNGVVSSRQSKPPDSARMSVASFVESSIVIESRYGAEGLHDLDRFISRANIELISVDGEQGQLARSAFSRFGKGRHRAGLSYGDCFSYAAAFSQGEPLLSKGDDFIHTDVPILEIGNG